MHLEQPACAAVASSWFSDTILRCHVVTKCAVAHLEQPARGRLGVARRPRVRVARERADDPHDLGAQQRRARREAAYVTSRYIA